MGFEVMKWTLAALSIVGVVLNIRRRRECFIVWCATNAAWTVVDVVHQVWAQAALQFVYFLLAIWGLIEWKKHS